MNPGGVLASMCFPTFPGFSGRFFPEADDKDLALVMLRAYNDWHIDERCRAYPGRFIPLALVPSGTSTPSPPRCTGWRPRAAGPSPCPRTAPRRACPAITATTGTPSSGPCCDNGVVMCLHIGRASPPSRDRS